jgi:hypothetical protein
MKTRRWKMEDGRREASWSAADLCRFFPAMPQRSTPPESARGLAQSKTWRQLIATLVFLTFALTVHAQSYSIDWYKVSGGGGTSAGGVYSVSDTIGQHDAGGPMTGGSYSLTGGFWALISVAQAPGRAHTLHQPCRQLRDGLLAGCLRLELASEQQPDPACQLDSQQRRNDLQRHELSEPHVAHGELVFPIEQSLKR